MRNKRNVSLYYSLTLSFLFVTLVVLTFHAPIFEIFIVDNKGIGDKSFFSLPAPHILDRKPLVCGNRFFRGRFASMDRTLTKHTRMH